MQLSKAGAGAIAAHEAIILQAYDDGVGVTTIGIGHTDMAGLPKVTPGMIIPLQRAFEIFENDMRKYEAGVTSAIRRPLKQHEFDSLTSFHFNTGAIRTGSVDDKLNAGNVDGALATLSQYNKGGGRVLAGLVTRRKEEVAIFRTGRYPSRKILVKDRKNSAGRLMDPAAIVWRGSVEAPSLALDIPNPPLVQSPVKASPAPQSTIWGWLKGILS